MISPAFPSGPLVSMFWEAFPRDFMRQVLMCLRDAYPIASYQAYSGHEQPEADNLRPFLRRAYIEENLRHIARPFSATVTATAKRGNSNWWNHTLVECGSVSFTESTVFQPDQIVRWSRDRDQYSADNRQKLLFDERVEPSEKSLYGILLHGREGMDRAKLGFAVVRFPLPKVAGYYESRIDLLKEFPGIVDDMAKPQSESDPTEQIGDDIDIDILPEEDIGG